MYTEEPGVYREIGESRRSSDLREEKNAYAFFDLAALPQEEQDGESRRSSESRRAAVAALLLVGVFQTPPIPKQEKNSSEILKQEDRRNYVLIYPLFFC
jgi:hypothetical protein